MNKRKLIGIHMRTLSTDMTYFAEKGVFRTVPQIIYAIDDEQVKEVHLDRPIEIFRENMNYKEFESVVKGDKENIDFMSMPGQAYKKMQHYIDKNVEKVLADMTVALITQIVKESDDDTQNIFFIDNRDNSNKIIGRLGYMYFDSMQNTFCFVTYKPNNLLTDALRDGSDVLEFDINYFGRQENREVSEIVPNDFMESMIQTVFYKMKSAESEVTPLRCDIFSQGISTGEIQEKVDIVKDVLAEQNNLSMPFETDSNWYVRIPYVLFRSIEASKSMICNINEILKE